MKKIIKPTLLVTLCQLSCANFCYADEVGSLKDVAPVTATNPIVTNLDAIVPVSAVKAGETTTTTPAPLIAPVVEDTKLKKPESSKRLD